MIRLYCGKLKISFEVFNLPDPGHKRIDCAVTDTSVNTEKALFETDGLKVPSDWSANRIAQEIVEWANYYSGSVFNLAEYENGNWIIRPTKY